MSMKLYWTPLSPYARKVIVAAHEHDLSGRIEMIETKVSPPNPELMQHNPLNKVPTLVLDDGTALYDSVVICEYFDSIGHGPELFPSAGTERWNALRRHALGTGFTDLLIAWRTEITQSPEMQSKERIEKYVLKMKRILELLEHEAHEERSTFNIGDLAIGCALAYMFFRFPQFAPGPASPLQRWYATFDARPSVAATRIAA
jgi:glutathione S-transferase